MGVPWGVVAYSASADRAEIIEEWGPLAQQSYEDLGLNILHGNDRIHFLPSTEPTVHHDPEARALVDALPYCDGSYDDFERLFDGYELFVPWDSFGAVHVPGSSRVDGKFAVWVRDLARWMKNRDDFPAGSDVALLASQLHAQATLATELAMIIEISF
ncbi:hypothetical protein LWC34_08765 [Kibdelosporangium philippinense]|uniref:Uncharacterized protein n=1 Tax=Kibdelosporangium philippinense TaxID=211113 RepID=A0ABS8Z777_9PSEU|nr:hypothetical protein [Kibdelosporangium philippinense]MCE7002923.1 hypothetical protein [Kibdelosporangium philippinense]